MNLFTKIIIFRYGYRIYLNSLFLSISFYFFFFSRNFSNPILISNPLSYKLFKYSKDVNITSSTFDIPKEKILNFYPQRYYADPNSLLDYFRFGKDYLINFRHTGNPGSPFHIVNSVASSSATFLTYKDAFVSGKGSFSFDLQTLITFKEKEIDYYNQFDGKLVCECDELIQTVSVLTRRTYGHVFVDLWGTLIFIPETVIERSYVIGSSYPKYYNQSLQLIGFRGEQIISINTDEWIFARKFHTVGYPRAKVTHFGPIYIWIYNKVNEKLNLTDIEPTRYILLNRRRPPRKFENWDQFVPFIQSTFPEINWEVIPDKEKNMTSTAKIYASIKLLFCSCGSSCMKCIFMREKTVVLAGITDIIELGTLTITLNRKIFLFFWRIPYSSHFSYGPCYIQYEYAIEAINAGLNVTKYHKFPSST